MTKEMGMGMGVRDVGIKNMSDTQGMEKCKISGRLGEIWI